MKPQTTRALPVIGWREWISLPDLDVKRIKVKIDTGARSSSLHAVKLMFFERDGKKWVRFQINPNQDNTVEKVNAEAKIHAFRSVRSSNGQSELRPVIRTRIQLMGQVWLIDLTLSNRDEMGFRMLLGRQAFRDKFIVDAGRSFYGKKSPQKKATKDQADTAYSTPRKECRRTHGETR